MSRHFECVLIYAAREPLLKMIEENQVTILLGETGCGKSTRISISSTCLIYQNYRNFFSQNMGQKGS
jgi:HrpA-like RNA helicase